MWGQGGSECQEHTDRLGDCHSEERGEGEGRAERELGLEGRQVSNAAKVLSLSPCKVLQCGPFQPSEPTKMFWAPSPLHSPSHSSSYLHPHTHPHTFTLTLILIPSLSHSSSYLHSHSSSYLHPHTHSYTFTLTFTPSPSHLTFTPFTLTHGGPARRSRSGKNCAVSDA